MFLPWYKMCISPKIISWTQADFFLLGERHEKRFASERPRWLSYSRYINGIFISYLSNFFPLTILVEGAPSMKKYDKDSEMAANLREKFYIDSPNPNIDFYGWDKESKDRKREEEEYIQLKEEKQKLEEKCLALTKEITTYLTEEPPSSYCSSYVDRMLLTFYSLKEACYCKSNEMRKNLDLQSRRVMIQSYPERTQSMVLTLRRVQQLIQHGAIQGKVVLIAGAFHLEEDKDLLDPAAKEAQSLTSLYQELKSLKATVMLAVKDGYFCLT